MKQMTNRPRKTGPCKSLAISSYCTLQKRSVLTETNESFLFIMHVMELML